MSGQVSDVDDLRAMSERMRARLDELMGKQRGLIESLAQKAAASNEFLRAAGDIAKV